jgi:hypothetical protein
MRVETIPLQWANTLSDLAGSLSPLGIAAAVAAIVFPLGALVYELIRRQLLVPELLIDAHVRGYHPRADHVNASITWLIVNAGR